MNYAKQLTVCLFALLFCVSLSCAQGKLPKVRKVKVTVEKPVVTGSVPRGNVGVNYRQPLSISPKTNARLERDVNKALESGKLKREDIIKAANTPILRGGPEGYTLSVPTEPREFTFSEFPQMPRGVELADYAEFLSAKRGQNYLDKSLAANMPVFEGSAQVKDAIKLMYKGITEGSIKTEEGLVGWQFANTIEDAISTAREVGAEYGVSIPLEITEVGLYAQAPDMFRMFAALSFREYMIQHGVSFPKYGEDHLLDIFIHGLWRRAITGELPTDSAEVLMESFAVGSDRGLSEILKDAQVFAQKNGHLPGIGILAMPPQKVIEFTKARRDTALSAEEKQEVSLGMELVLATKMLPAVGWKITDDQLPPLLKAYGNLIDQEVEQMKAAN